MYCNADEENQVHTEHGREGGGKQTVKRSQGPSDARDREVAGGPLEALVARVRECVAVVSPSECARRGMVTNRWEASFKIQRCVRQCAVSAAVHRGNGSGASTRELQGVEQVQLGP